MQMSSVCKKSLVRHRSRGGATFADGERTLPQRVNLFDDVSSALPGYTPYFVANDSGPVTDSDNVRLRQDFGIATWDRLGAKTISVIQLHGLRDPAGKQDTPARAKQPLRTRFDFEKSSATSDTVALCGDLNLLPSSTTFQVLQEHGMVDLVGDAVHQHRNVRWPRHSSVQIGDTHPGRPVT